jgi:hypothetical protein
MKKREQRYWQYWLALVVGTVVITAGLTWLAMNVGAQGMPNVIEASSQIAEPPQVVFESVKMVGNTIEIDHGKCKVDKDHAVEVAFRNEGKGTLRIQLTETSCKCVHDIEVNGQRMKQGETWVEVPGGQRGVIRFGWHPKKEQLASRNLRLSASFLLPNDPQPHFSNGLRLEITTEVTE